MKIFSTFDTNLKRERVSFFEEKYGKGNIHVIERSRVFWWMMVFIPLMEGVLFTTIMGVTTWYLFENVIAVYRGLGISTVISTFLYFSALKNYIDYTMDYCIVTPDEVILTEQEGILKRTVRTLDGTKVKSIYIDKQKLIYSVFDTGKIVFMSDGDEQFGEITFDYIKDPELQKDKVQKVMNMNQNKNK